MRLIKLTKVTIGICIALSMVACQSTAEIKANAEAELAVFASQAGMTAVSCVGVDTDQNWRVGCTAKDSAGVLQAIECSYQVGGGCMLDTRTKISQPYQ
jgi:hypothetical protein